MKMLRLPSGESLNADMICRWGELKESEHVWDKTTLKVSNGTYLDVVFSGNVEGQYNNADARALYEWLTANSVAIGEDGREVVNEAPKAQTPPASMTDHAVNFLRALDRAFPYGLSTTIACDDFDVTSTELDFMAHEHYIIATPDGWRSTSRGFDFLANLDEAQS